MATDSATRTARAVVEIVDGVRVVVPDSLDLITPYVLREQRDWFEDEIGFVRRAVAPGECVVDIGANYGVYALSMARRVGPAGRVIAFEPASATASLLADSIAANGFANVVLDRRAVSSAPGSAMLHLDVNSELNGLARDAAATGTSESVALTTLDIAMREHGWPEVAFVKIDAEGEEDAIIRGGEAFFSAQSPLVQYEVKAGQRLHLALAERFAALGYASFRLVPGLGALAPFDASESPDEYLLNLFSCKPDRAARLAAAGLLVTREALDAAMAGGDALGERYDWRERLCSLPYGRPLAAEWEEVVAEGRSGEVLSALACHEMSRDPEVPLASRVAALARSVRLLADACRAPGTPYLRRASLARVAREYGARGMAMGALWQQMNAAISERRIDPTEPFLSPLARFDTIAPGPHLGDWVVAALLEAIERHGAFSSFYTGLSAAPRLEMLARAGYADEEMTRRLALVRARFGSAVAA